MVACMICSITIGVGHAGEPLGVEHVGGLRVSLSNIKLKTQRSSVAYLIWSGEQRISVLKTSHSA